MPARTGTSRPDVDERSDLDPLLEKRTREEPSRAPRTPDDGRPHRMNPAHIVRLQAEERLSSVARI